MSECCRLCHALQRVDGTSSSVQFPSRVVSYTVLPSGDATKPRNSNFPAVDNTEAGFREWLHHSGAAGTPVCL